MQKSKLLISLKTLRNNLNKLHSYLHDMQNNLKLVLNNDSSESKPTVHDKEDRDIFKFIEIAKTQLGFIADAQGIVNKN